METKKERILVLDILTGIAIILVVLGHHKFLREYADWYLAYDAIIYSFHMGFFMCISGVLIKYSYHPDMTYWEYVKRKIKKFVPPYLIVGIIGALIANISVFSLPRFIKDIALLLYSPLDGEIQIIWYIYVLLIFYLITPFIMKLSKEAFYVLLALAVGMSCISHVIPDIFCLSAIFRLFVFYLLGVLICEHRDKIKTVKNQVLFYLSIPFLLFCVSCIWLNFNPLAQFGGVCKFVPSLLSLPFMLLLARWLSSICFCRKGLCVISKYAFQIYFIQMFIIQAMWMVYIKIFHGIGSIAAIFYVIISTTITILSIIWMVKFYNQLVKIKR